MPKKKPWMSFGDRSPEAPAPAPESRAAKATVVRIMRCTMTHPEWVQLQHRGTGAFDSVPPSQIKGDVALGTTVYFLSDGTYSTEVP